MSLIKEIQKDLFDLNNNKIKYKIISSYIDKLGFDTFVENVYEINFEYRFFKSFNFELNEFLTDKYKYKLITDRIPNEIIIPKIKKITFDYEIEIGDSYIYLDPIDYEWSLFYEGHHSKIKNIYKIKKIK